MYIEIRHPSVRVDQHNTGINVYSCYRGVQQQAAFSFVYKCMAINFNGSFEVDLIDTRGYILHRFLPLFSALVYNLIKNNTSSVVSLCHPMRTRGVFAC
jgi:hypothetical protein